MRYVKIEMTVKPELAASIMDLVKADVVSLCMTMVDGEQAKPLPVRTRAHSLRKGGMPASEKCALKLMQSSPTRGWTTMELGLAMHAAEQYAVTSASSVASALIKNGYASRGENRLVFITDAGRAA